MKNTINYLKTGFTAICMGILFILSACSENNPLNSNGNEFQGSIDVLPPSTITIEPYWHNGFLYFIVKNNTVDTIINDFHVQFDSTVKITGWSVCAGWQIDPQTTDTAKGKFGVKCGPQGQAIPPGGQAVLIGLQIKYPSPRKNNPNQWWDFDWQATQNGVIVKAGKAAFPNR